MSCDHHCATRSCASGSSHKPNSAPRGASEVADKSRIPKPAELHLLAASMAHEIRNSLAGVRGAVEVLGSNYAEQTEQRHVFNEILRRLDGVNHTGWRLARIRKTAGREERDGVRLIESLEAVLSALTLDTRLQCITIVKEYRCHPVLRADPTCWNACS